MNASTFVTKRMLSGTGTLQGPAPNTQFDTVIALITKSLPRFAESVLNERIQNENGLNSRLSRFITNVAHHTMLPFFADRESMEDEERGDSPALDIGIYLYKDDIADLPPKIAVFEGKRLTSALERKRRKEYVVGHEEAGKHVVCGGIERFKLSRHARDCSHAGMIGYVQDGTPGNWLKSVNKWISELSQERHEPSWSPKEKLVPMRCQGSVFKYGSVVYRSSGTLRLTHLWINLGSELT